MCCGFLKGTSAARDRYYEKCCGFFERSNSCSAASRHHANHRTCRCCRTAVHSNNKNQQQHKSLKSLVSACVCVAVVTRVCDKKKRGNVSFGREFSCYHTAGVAPARWLSCNRSIVLVPPRSSSGIFIELQRFVGAEWAICVLCVRCCASTLLSLSRASTLFSPRLRTVP